MVASEPLYVLQAEQDGRVHRSEPMDIDLAERMRKAAELAGVIVTVVRKTV
jgi:hypothetical protein